MNQPQAGQNPGWFGGPPPQQPLPNSPTMPTIQAPSVGETNTSGTTVPGTQPTLATMSAPAQVEPTFATQLAGEDRTVAAPPAPAPAAVGPASPSGSFATRMAVEEGEETISTINVAPAKLIVTRNGQAREFLLKKADISIGRAPSNEVPLSGDQLASRRHALIRFDGINFTIRDVGSANGTYVNGVELRAPAVLRNGDHISVGEHEVIFFTGAANEEEEPPTITNVPPAQLGEPQTFATSNVFGGAEGPEVTPESTQAHGMSGSGIAVAGPQEEDAATRIAELDSAGMEVQAPAWIEPGVQATSTPSGWATPDEVPPTIIGEPVAAASPEASLPPATIIERRVITEDVLVAVSVEEQAQDEQMPEPQPLGKGLVAPPPPVEEDMPLPVPQLPEVSPILSAIQALDSKTAEMRDRLQQAKALEQEAQQLRDQLKAASEMIAVHDNAVAQLAQRLRVGVADVANRLKQVVDEVSRAEESLSINDMMKLIEDVRNDPRDIYTVGSLARRARELGQFFELHQHINQILTSCLATLNELMAFDATQSSES
jgi:pSer/pThr/pTyr-binding forkhead associated (FHA) protein